MVKLLAEVQQANKALYRAFLLKEELRLVYQLERPALSEKHLDARLDWASRSRLEPFVKLARTIRLHRHSILAAIRLDLTNGRLEGLQQPHPPDLTQELRLSLRSSLDRPHLPLLQRHHNRVASVTVSPPNEPKRRCSTPLPP
jgi:Transposase